MTRTARRLAIALLCGGPVFAATITSNLTTTPYWYNGDPDGFYEFLSEVNGGLGTANAYDDFNVLAGGVTVGAVFSNDIVFSGSAAVTQAEWEIRSGVSSSDGGTVVAEGTSAVNEIDTGTQVDGDELYTFEVTGLEVPLTAGTYWLSVAPVFAADDDSSGAFVVTTAGANGIGSPQAQDGNSIESDTFGDNFAPAIEVAGEGDPMDGHQIDLSEGIEPVTTPEPRTGVLIVSSFLLLGLLRLARRSA